MYVIYFLNTCSIFISQEKEKYRELSIHVYAYSKFFSSEMENIVKKN